MRTIVCGSLFVCLAMVVGERLRADDQADVKSILDKAIQATGGEEKLSKVKAGTSKSKGKISIGGADIEFTADGAYQLPNQSRNHIDGEFGGQKFTRTQIFNGEKGWIVMNGQVEDMNADQIEQAKEDLYNNKISNLLPLKDPAFKLAPLGESKSGDKTLVGIKVSHAGQKDTNLYFDKETGLLVKTEKRVKDQMTGSEVDQEATMTDYQEIDGLKHPKKITIKRDGNAFLELEILEVKSADKLEDSLFARPKE